MVTASAILGALATRWAREVDSDLILDPAERELRAGFARRAFYKSWQSAAPRPAAAEPTGTPARPKLKAPDRTQHPLRRSRRSYWVTPPPRATLSSDLTPVQDSPDDEGPPADEEPGPGGRRRGPRGWEFPAIEVGIVGAWQLRCSFAYRNTDGGVVMECRLLV